MTTLVQTSPRDSQALRRSALVPDQGPTDEQQGWGGYPLGRLLRQLGDPQDPTRVSFPFLRRIRGDHIVAMGTHFIHMPILKAQWYFEADDARVSQMADNIIRPIYGDIVEIVLRFLWAGFSPAAVNYSIINPKWTYFINGQAAPVWDQGGIGAVVVKDLTPLIPEYSRPLWKNGTFDGITFDGRYGGPGSFSINGQKRTDVDKLHSLWAVHERNAHDGSAFGFPRIAYCAPIFHMYRFIWTLLGRAFENNADPGPTVGFPQEGSQQLDSDGTQIDNAQIALRIGRRKRSGSTIAIPSDTYTDNMDKPTGVKKWSVEYVPTSTSFESIQHFIGFLEASKLRALWLQEQGLIEAVSGGSSNRNVAQTFGSQRDASQAALMGQVVKTIMALIKPIMQMNMPWYEGSLRMMTIGFGQDDTNFIQQIMQLAGQQPGGLAQFGIDLRRLAESRGFPMLDHAAQQKLIDAAAAQANTNPAPEVRPTQGRRALVTQTGFDRESGQPVMSYHQIDQGPIYLSDDAEFLTSLPRTDVYADRAIVATTRDLRNTSATFLTWVYADFAKYVGKQRINLADELEEEDGTELDAGGRARKVVDKLIGGWIPSYQRLSDYTRTARSQLGRVFDRTVGIQLGKVGRGGTTRVSSTDKIAAAWLNERGMQMVSGIMETTRQQLVDTMTTGVLDGKTPQEIAADIRADFEGVPAWRAAMIARTEVGTAYNYATATAGIAAGVKRAQLMDGNQDEPCKKRNGLIVKLSDALKERLNHPNCTLYLRLLPNAPANFEVRVEPLDGFHARYDIDSETALFSPDIDPDQRVQFLIALGDRFSVVLEDETG